MKTIPDIIKQWEETIATLEKLIALSNPSDAMLCIMITRKNQLIECINDLQKVSGQ